MPAVCRRGVREINIEAIVLATVKWAVLLSSVVWYSLSFFLFIFFKDTGKALAFIAVGAAFFGGGKAEGAAH